MYQNDKIIKKQKKKKLQKEARERHQNLSEEETEKKRQYGRERYKNLLEDEYRKQFSRMQEIKIIRVIIFFFLLYLP